MKIIIPVLVIAAVAGTACALQGRAAEIATSTETSTTAKIGEAVPAFSAAASDGKTYSIKDFEGKWVILEWTNKDCPFVKKFYGSGRMQAFQKRVKNEDIVWLSVCSSAQGNQGYMTAEQHNNHLKAVNATPHAVLMDADGKLGRMFNAQTTPQVVLIDPKGVMLYNGAIDDRPSPNPADLDGAKNYLFAALNEARAGKPVTTPTTRPYGCGVKY